MSTNTRRAIPAAFFLFPLMCFAALASEPAMVESPEIFLVEAEGVPGRIHPGDLAQSQILEIIRPETIAVTVGRLSTSCTCITAGAEKKTFGPGERALVEVRNVKPTPLEGATYMVFVELAGPTRGLLIHALFVKSDFPGR